MQASQSATGRLGGARLRGAPCPARRRLRSPTRPNPNHCANLPAGQLPCKAGQQGGSSHRAEEPPPQEQGARGVCILPQPSACCNARQSRQADNSQPEQHGRGAAVLRMPPRRKERGAQAHGRTDRQRQHCDQHACVDLRAMGQGQIPQLAKGRQRAALAGAGAAVYIASRAESYASVYPTTTSTTHLGLRNSTKQGHKNYDERHRLQPCQTRWLVPTHAGALNVKRGSLWNAGQKVGRLLYVQSLDPWRLLHGASVYNKQLWRVDTIHITWTYRRRCSRPQGGASPHLQRTRTAHGRDTVQSRRHGVRPIQRILLHLGSHI